MSRSILLSAVTWSLALCLHADTPPQATNLLVWGDFNDASAVTLSEGRVIQLDDKSQAGSALAFRQAGGNPGPLLLPGSSGMGDTAYFNGTEFLLLQEETSPGVWEDAQVQSTDGFSVFVIARCPTGTGISWQSMVGWKQNGSVNTIHRPLRFTGGVPIAEPDGHSFFYNGGTTGWVIDLTDVLLGGKNSNNGYASVVNPVSDTYIAEVLIYGAAFDEDIRMDIMEWLHVRNGLSTDRSNPAGHIDPRFMHLKALVPDDAEFQIAAAGNSNFFRPDLNISSYGPLDIYPCTESTLGAHYQLITPTNDFKLSEVAPTFSDSDDTAPHDWTITDPYVEWCVQRGIDIRGHTLIWHNGAPSSMSNYTWKGGAWTEQEMLTLFTDHITEMVSRYTSTGARSDLAGVVKVWDVVNEAAGPSWNYDPDTEPWQDGIATNRFWIDGGDGPGGRPGLGTSYIEEAFQIADAACDSDDISLHYNDFSNAELNTKSDLIYNMCVDFLSRDVPIDGVGLQMHINTYGLDMESFRQNVRRFKALDNGNFEVHITELDIGIPGLTTREKLVEQGQLAYEITKIALEEGVDALTTWGVHDYWYSGSNRGYRAGLPFVDTRIVIPSPPEGEIPIDHPLRRLSHLEPKPFFCGIRQALVEHFGFVEKSFPVEISPTVEQSYSLQFYAPLAGVYDLLGSDSINQPFYPVGETGQWVSWTIENPGLQSVSFVDPDASGTTSRYWRILLSPRPNVNSTLFIP